LGVEICLAGYQLLHKSLVAVFSSTNKCGVALCSEESTSAAAPTLASWPLPALLSEPRLNPTSLPRPRRSPQLPPERHGKRRSAAAKKKTKIEEKERNSERATNGKQEKKDAHIIDLLHVRSLRVIGRVRGFMLLCAYVYDCQLYGGCGCIMCKCL